MEWCQYWRDDRFKWWKRTEWVPIWWCHDLKVGSRGTPEGAPQTTGTHSHDSCELLSPVEIRTDRCGGLTNTRIVHTNPEQGISSESRRKIPRLGLPWGLGGSRDGPPKPGSVAVVGQWIFIYLQLTVEIACDMKQLTHPIRMQLLSPCLCECVSVYYSVDMSPNLRKINITLNGT